MGEEPSRVFNYGDTCVENCMNMKLLSREELAEQIRFKYMLENYCVVTFHPVTMENDTAEFQVNELIRAMDMYPEMAFIITKANADAGGRRINEIWEEASKTREKWHVVSSLGVQRYLSAVKNSCLVIGNSSSGLIEAPVLKIPTINIGDRQKGRMMAESVISCEPDADAISNAMERGLSEEFKASITDMELPYGNGTTSTLITNKLISFLSTMSENPKKSFYDLVL